MKHGLKHIITVLTLVILTGTMFYAPKVQAQQYSEYEIKAAYIFNFAKFISWPPEAFENDQAPFVLGIYGEDPFGDILIEVMRGRLVKGRKWVIKRSNDINDLSDCQILFVSKSKKDDLKNVFAATKGKTMLTIGDNIENFCQQGGIINFSSKEMKYGFEIKEQNARLAGIRLSSKLLVLARLIE